ncbi:hypothetical protein OSTOST_16682 [Ostertagia ostertagi]
MEDYFAPRTCHGRQWMPGMGKIARSGRRFTRVDPYLRSICTYTGVCYSHQ